MRTMTGSQLPPLELPAFNMHPQPWSRSSSPYKPLSPTSTTTPQSMHAHRHGSPRRSRNPSPFHNHHAHNPRRISPRTKVTYRLSHLVSALLRPKILSPIILWTCALYLVHLFLLPLPVFQLSNPLSKASSKSSSSAPPTSDTFFLSTAYPPPPERPGDAADSVDPRFRPFKPLDPPEAPFPRLRPTRFLPSECLDMWFEDGEMDCTPEQLGEEEQLDATWLWVNGSDPRWLDAMVKAREEAGIYSPERHFREQNELVYSMRSVLAALPGKVKSFHLITIDHPFDPSHDVDLLPPAVLETLEPGSTLSESISPKLQEELSSWRIAQAPTWLDYSKLDAKKRFPQRGQTYPLFRYAGHSEIFHLPTFDRDGKTEELGEREWKQEQFRRLAMPNFNSMAIESRIGWLPGLADVTLALNDDFFLLRPHAVSDFHSPLYGSVIRFDPSWKQQVKPILDKAKFKEAGEAGGLYHANWLLSHRFPRRLRPYFAHVPKVITRGLHHETSLMFAEALAVSSRRRFREVTIGHGDVQMQWLLTSLRVERWREALLWTYFVANLGANGPLGDHARDRIEDLFGIPSGDRDIIKVEVHRGERKTLEWGRMHETFLKAGWEPPRETQILWSSMDGHIPEITQPGSDTDVNKCELDLDVCFGPFWSKGHQIPAEDVFKRFAFQIPKCGDCMIMALVTASGPLGLKAFFPAPGTTYENAPLQPGKTYPKYMPPPHLPLTSTWSGVDFSLAKVLEQTALPGEEVDLREWCMRLLSRYQYISGRSNHRFHMLINPGQTDEVFKSIDSQEHASILGINDDINAGYELVRDKMAAWFEKRWPNKALWER